MGVSQVVQWRLTGSLVVAVQEVERLCHIVVYLDLVLLFSLLLIGKVNLFEAVLGDRVAD